MSFQMSPKTERMHMHDTISKESGIDFDLPNWKYLSFPDSTFDQFWNILNQISNPGT